uniref:Uncharacterized protein n=1 Tax=Anguilla anguilla TaxID=7936 RepID=A0A0E9RHW3_ANGAN
MKIFISGALLHFLFPSRTFEDILNSWRLFERNQQKKNVFPFSCLLIYFWCLLQKGLLLPHSP